MIYNGTYDNVYNGPPAAFLLRFYSLNYNVEVKRGRSRECTGGNKLKIRCMRIVLNFATFGNLGILNILNLVSSIWNHIYVQIGY